MIAHVTVVISMFLSIQSTLPTFQTAALKMKKVALALLLMALLVAGTDADRDLTHSKKLQLQCSLAHARSVW